MTAVKRESPHRQTRKEKALATRRRIIECALAAFTDQGFAETTVEKVAKEAGVAVQTVYFTFRTKGDLLQAVYEHVVLGPDGMPPHLTSWWRRVEEEPAIADAVRVLVDGTTELLERAAPVVAAVWGDPTARTGYELNEGMRRQGYEQLVRILSAKHPLRAGLTDTTARDVLLVLTGPLLYTQLTTELKWSREEISVFMTTAVLRELFAFEP